MQYLYIPVSVFQHRLDRSRLAYGHTRWRLRGERLGQTARWRSLDSDLCRGRGHLMDCRSIDAQRSLDLWTQLGKFSWSPKYLMFYFIFFVPFFYLSPFSITIDPFEPSKRRNWRISRNYGNWRLFHWNSW